MSKIMLVGAEPDKMPRLKLVYKSLKSLGHDVKIFAPFQKNGNSIMRYLANMVKLFFEKSDEYHFFNIPDVIGLPLLFKRGRLVYDVRSPWEEGVMDAKKNKILAKIAGVIERLFCLKADMVVSANPLLAKRARMFGARKTVNVPNFPYKKMSTARWENVREAFEKKDGKEEAFVLFFGKISIPEGSEVLADVIIKTLKINYDLFRVRFIILGDGPEFHNLIDKISDARLLDRVHFLGWMPHSVVGRFIKAADLCIMPREEGGTTKWMHPDCIWKVNEAVNIGTPILATEYGGFNNDNVFPLLLLTKNKDYPENIINVLDVVLRWGKIKEMIPENRNWKVSREKLKEVYGNGID
jgi:glycosyltransferase involved in cell wall biosynthesis